MTGIMEDMPINTHIRYNLLIFQLAWGGVYRYHVDMDTYDSAITIEHFLMMGSHGNGTYNVKDMRFTRSFPTHEEKVENNKKVYLEHLRENGVLGNLKLAIKKEAIVWQKQLHHKILKKKF